MGSGFDKTLKVNIWHHLEQIPALMVMFVRATFVLVTFVHIRNISAATDRFFEISFLGAIILLDHNFVPPKFFWNEQFFRQKLFDDDDDDVLSD